MSEKDLLKFKVSGDMDALNEEYTQEQLDALMRGDVDAFTMMVEDEEADELESNPDPKVDDVKGALKSAIEDHELMRKTLRDRDYAFTDLSQAQLTVAKNLSATLDEDDLTQLTNFGVLAQEQMGTFSKDLLLKVQSPVGNMKSLESDMTNLITALSTNKQGDLNVNNTTWLQRIMKPRNNKTELIQSNYEEIAKSVELVKDNLIFERDVLLEDIHSLQELYNKNKGFYASVNVFIAAGMLKLDELVEEIIPAALEKAVDTGSAADVQAVNDLVGYMNRLEKRVYDLKLTRQISIQQAPQIKIAQETNQQLSEKINSAINIAIPAWQNQIMLSTTIGRQKRALELQKSVTDTTNNLLRNTADLLHDSTIAVAIENERGVVDLETLEYTQDTLIKTIGETIDIQREGRQKRLQVEHRLVQMNEEMKHSLLTRVAGTMDGVTEPIDVTPEDELIDVKKGKKK